MTALHWLESGPVALIVRATAILVVALALHRSLRGASALSRHALWATVMIGLLALPLLQLRMPRLGIPGWRVSTSSVDTPSASTPVSHPVRVEARRAAASIPTSLATVATASSGVSTLRRTAVIPWQVLLILGWCIGGVAVLVPIVVGMRRGRRLVSEAIPVHNRRMLARLAHLQRVTRVNRPVALRVSERVRTPMAWGYRRPAILLPIDAADWTADRFDAVLVHELVHIRRGDTIHQAIARLASACYWFHPMVWQGTRLAAAARERACDDAVLRFGTRPSHYARHLMELAEHGTTMTSMPALARLHHPNLEDRVMTILSQAPARQSPWRAAFAVAAVSTWTLAIAAVGPVAAQQPAPPAPPAAEVIELPARPALPAAMHAPRAPGSFTVPSGPIPPVPASPAAPAVAAPPAPPTPPADCGTESSRGVVVERSDARDQPTHMMRRNLEDGRVICLAVRGVLAANFTLSPLGNLPSGVVITLEASREGSVQRMEITSGAKGNTHRWLVNGSERPFDTEAREWRDAMLAVLTLGMERSRVESAAASRAATAMQAHAEEMALESRATSDMHARVITEHAAAMEDQARAVSAQHASVEAAVAQVHAQAMRVDSDRQTRIERAQVAVMHERASVQSRQMREQHAAMAAAHARVRETSEQMRVSERAMADQARVLQTESRRLGPLERRLQEIIERVGPR
ncbi:MAG: M56 family metallopeptidase [Gemmatimonadota bacterium]